MKGRIGTALALLLLVSQLWAQDLAEQELKSVSLGTVEFVNYEGPHERIDTLNQILAIGRSLAGGANDGKYWVQRIYDADAEELGADLFYIGAGAQVDHIRNLRRILAAYLAEAYAYEFQDAEILAEFSTYYNAVHRGDIAYFETAYQPPVTAALDPDKAGLATVWSQWAGQTQMLFPLRGRPGSGEAGVVDTDALTDDAVIGKLQSEEDKGIPERKEMTELKEREIDEEQAAIDEERQTIAAEEAAISAEEAALETDKEELEQQREEVEETTDPAERQQQEEELQRQEQAVASREEQLESRREETAERSRAADEAQTGVDERVDRIRDERQTIAEDERSLIEERREEAAVQVPFLYLEGGPDKLRRLVASDSRNGEILRRSPLTTIHSEDLQIIGDSYLVIAGDEGGNRAVRLVRIDPESFEMSAQGDTDVFAKSFILVNGSRIYAVIQDNGYRVGRFAADLRLQQASELEVVPETWLTLNEGSLYAQDSAGRIIVLDPTSLAAASE